MFMHVLFVPRAHSTHSNPKIITEILDAEDNMTVTGIMISIINMFFKEF